MKKVLAIILMLTLLTTALVGCSSKKEKEKIETPDTPPTNENQTIPDMTIPGTSEPAGTTANAASIKEGTKIEDIVMKLGEELGIAMPEKADDTSLKEVFGINKEDIDEYYGEYSVVNTSADNIIGIKAKENKIPDVKKALEERKNNVNKTFEQYLPDQLEKAKAGKIIEKGNYLFLVIAGDAEKGVDKEMQRAEEIINSYFQK